MPQVICSHGFGVDATDRGLFSDIAKAFPDMQFTMFDYNKVDIVGNMTVQPLEIQADILNKQLNKNHEDVILLCHSQGCITAALADLSDVTKLIFLTPPENLDIDRFAKVFGARPGADFNPNGLSSIPRRDSTTTYIGTDYLESIANVDVQQLFQQSSYVVPTTIIRAMDDEIVGQTSFPNVYAEIITLPGGHDFKGEHRQALLRKLHEILD